MTDLNIPQKETMFGHPTGLFTLFFAELWERFSYYGMRALLVFYMIKGFMSYGDGNAYTIYGAYTALVYMTPFFGGMIADRLIGARRAVILGGLFMSAGHLMMTIEFKNAFFTALALLIVGNGFFKPNISTMVGSLYPQGSPKRDGGFTIFYIGINLGAAIAPLLCGFVGERYGWHKGFGLATIGMLTGLAVFIAPTVISQLLLFVSCAAATLNILELEPLEAINPYLNVIVAVTLVLAGVVAFVSLGKREQSGNLHIGFVSNTLTQLLILCGAGGIAFAMFRFHPDDLPSTIVFYAMAIVLLLAALVSVVALGRAGLPAGAGLSPSLEKLRESRFGITNEWLVYLGALLAVPVLMLFVSGFEPLFGREGGVQLIPDRTIKQLEYSESPLIQIVGTVAKESSRPAGLILMLAGLVALAYLFSQIFRLNKVPRQRMYVVMILTFFSMLFWSFFEQAGSSVNNFTDRNVDRVNGAATALTEADVEQEKTVRLAITLSKEDQELASLNQLTQEFLGYENGDPTMPDRLARVIRLVDRHKIENRDLSNSYDEQIDKAKDQLIETIWDQTGHVEIGDVLKAVNENGEIDPQKLPAPASASSDALANSESADTDHDEPDKTPEQKLAEWEAEQQWSEFVEAKVRAAVKASPELTTEDLAAEDLLVGQLVKRLDVEKTVEAVNKEKRLTMTGLTYLREYVKIFDDPAKGQTLSFDEKTIPWKYTRQNVGMMVGGSEVPASVYQAVNPIFILIFGLIFTMIWGYMGARGIEPSTPVKFAMGLIQLGMGFGCFFIGAATASDGGMVALIWLLLGYLFQTTGELCLSPVGLSMVTRLSPHHLVSTVMGTWFLATAFSQFLAAIIAQFTGVSHGGGGSMIPVPAETVDVYGNVFKLIAISAIASGIFCLILSPILRRWMHEDVEDLDIEAADNRD